MTTHNVAIARVTAAIETIRTGGMVIMVDDEDRENEGDLVFAATHVCPEKINFMSKHARGLICLSLDQSDVDRLKLPMMADTTKRGSGRTTAFTVSIEACEGVTTGISAADRAHTIKLAVDNNSTPDDFAVPGHVFPLKARPGGVLQRAGHTEGSVDIARLAGLKSAAVICEIMNDDGTMARRPDLEKFSAQHQIPIISIADLITFRLMKESLIEEVRSAPIQTAYGTFQGFLFKSVVDGLSHFALVKGDAFEQKVVDVRVHRQRPLADVFGLPEEGSRFRINYGLKMLRDAEAAVFIYLTEQDQQESLVQEFEELQETKGPETESHRPWVEDSRMLGLGAQILRQLGVRQMAVHMSSPRPLKGLTGFDLEVVETKRLSGETKHD